MGIEAIVSSISISILGLETDYLTFSTAMILDCSSISVPLATAISFFSVAVLDPSAIVSNIDSQAAVFSVTATFCTASFLFSSSSCICASAILVRPPARRSHYGYNRVIKLNESI